MVFAVCFLYDVFVISWDDIVGYVPVRILSPLPQKRVVGSTQIPVLCQLDNLFCLEWKPWAYMYV